MTSKFPMQRFKKLVSLKKKLFKFLLYQPYHLKCSAVHPIYIFFLFQELILLLSSIINFDTTTKMNSSRISFRQRINEQRDDGEVNKYSEFKTMHYCEIYYSSKGISFL